MSGGLFRRKNRRRFEDLAVEHIDGVLDEQGERLLAELTRADPELSRQLAEMESVNALVRSQPQAAPPRSFALPYAPRHAGRGRHAQMGASPYGNRGHRTVLAHRSRHRRA